MAHIENKYTVPGLHVNFVEEKQKTQLSGLLTEDGLRGMKEKRNCYAAYTVFPFVALFNDRSFGFGERCDFTRMSSLYTEMVDKMLFDYP